MEVYLASAAGLLSWCGKWRKIPTPLAHPTLLAACGADVALADSVNRLLYRQGRVSTLPPGVEVLRCWRNQLLTLSSETNCLTLYDAHDYPLVTSPAGIRPCDCAVVDCQVIVCGCEDGCLHIFPCRICGKLLHIPFRVVRCGSRRMAECSPVCRC